MFDISQVRSGQVEAVFDVSQVRLGQVRLGQVDIS